MSVYLFVPSVFNLLLPYSKTCLKGHSKIDKTKMLMTNGS